MFENHFRAICNLNRLLILSFMFFTLNAVLPGSGLWEKIIPAAVWLLHLVFLMGNEFLFKLTKRVKGLESETLSYLSIFIPLALGIYSLINYIFTGSLAVYLFGFFAMLEAQFLGQSKIAKLLGVIQIPVLAIGFVFGYPHFSSSPSLLQLFLAVTVGGISLFYFGNMVFKLIKSHTNEVGKLQSMAATDALTGLTNRRHFNTRLHEEVSRARRHETPLTLALFDLDDFKRLNDFYGHPVGDRILRELGRILRQNIRESDLPARYGGEEFALILPATKESEAYELLERLRLLVAQTVFCLPENPLTLTISVGIAQLNPRQHTAFELVEFADKALYEAKKQGKNRVIKASSLISTVLLSKKPMA